MVDSLLPLLAGGTVLIFAACLAAMGVRRFYDRPVGWRQTALITGLGFAGIDFLRLRLRQQPIRMFIYSVAQVMPFALTLKLLLSRENGRVNAGARLAATVAILIIAIYVMRVRRATCCMSAASSPSSISARSIRSRSWC